LVHAKALFNASGDEKLYPSRLQYQEGLDKFQKIISMKKADPDDIIIFMPKRRRFKKGRFFKILFVSIFLAAIAVLFYFIFTDKDGFEESPPNAVRDTSRVGGM